jgi:hypothetical protein
MTMLKEQATALSEETSGLLRGNVSTASDIGDSQLYITLNIIVPALNNYRFEVLTYSQPITMFPGTLHSAAGNSGHRINNEQEFDSHLKSILASPEISAVVAALIAQARDLSRP